MNEPRSPRFYFALPRLLALLRHGDSRRAEMNGAEAWAGSIGIFLISYLFFAEMIASPWPGWLKALLLVALPFFVLLFWVLALFLNSLILKALLAFGAIRSLPVRRGQAVLVGTAATAMALQLWRAGSLTGEIAAIWLVAVAMNLAAALILAVRHGNAIRS